MGKGARFTFGGTLKSGEAFYYTRRHALAIEKDFQHLVDATQEERAEIYAKLPHLKPKTEFLPTM